MCTGSPAPDGASRAARGPDLVWLTGYRPAARTERMAALILLADFTVVGSGSGRAATSRAASALNNTDRALLVVE